MDKFVTKLSSPKDTVVEKLSVPTSLVPTENRDQEDVPSTRTNSCSTKEDCESDSDIEKNIPNKKKRYTRKFRHNWKEEFDFISQDKDKNTICKMCSVVIKGSGYNIKRHGASESHKAKSQCYKTTPKIDAVLKTDPKLLLDKQIRQAEIKIASFICDNNLPLSLVDGLTDLLQDPVFQNPEVLKNIKLKRTKTTNLITDVLGPAAKDDVYKRLRQEKFSLIIDETTDVSTKKTLVVNARVYHNQSCSVKDQFIELIEVENATADSLFSSVKNLLDANEIPYNNVIGFGADNANVMMGQFNSVQKKMSEICPGIIVKGCGCHSLHLVASYAAKKMPSVVEQFVRDIYNYFSNSSKRSEELKECQIFAEEKPTKILRPCQTRWLSLKEVCNRILEHWNSLTLYFQRAAIEDNLPAAKTILSALQNPVFKLYLQFLSFNLDRVTQLNVEFQSEQSKVPVFLDRISTLYKIVLKSFMKRSVIDSARNLNSIDVQNPHNYLDINQIYFGGKVDAFLKDEHNVGKIIANDLHTFKLKCLDFYIELAHQLKSRFDFNDKYLTFASLFTPKNAVSGHIQSISEFSHLFPSLSHLDIDKVNSEWQLLSEMNDLRQVSDLTSFWGKVATLQNENRDLIFRNVFEVTKCVLAIPHSSASAERVFSQLSLIKNKLRNKLLIKTCSALLSVKQYLTANKDFPIMDKKMYTHVAT